MENQLTILSESLKKKQEVLERIQKYNKQQEQFFSTEPVDMNAFDAAVVEKGKLIEELTKLDVGFEIMYEKLSDQLKNNREKYAEQIREIQKQITIITEMSMTIQTQEKRNKQLIEKYFSKARANLRENRKSSKAVYDYYKKVSNIDYAPPQYYDSKK